MNIFDLLQLVANNIWLYGIPFLLVLTLLVFVHEWGHYIVARMCGVKIQVFSIGFGKEIFGFTDKAGTRWKFAMVPLGGYVKMFGDTDPASAGHSEEIKEEEDIPARPMSEEEKKNAFFAKPLWQRAAIVFGGPAVNFLFAIFLFIGLYYTLGKPVTPPVATAVIEGSAAEKAGFQPHDKIISINGNQVNRFDQVRRSVMISMDEPLEITVLRDGRKINLKAKPSVLEAEDRFGFKHSRGMLGIIGPNNGIQISNILSVNGESTDGDVKRTKELLASNFGQTFHIRLDRAGEGDSLIIQPEKEFIEYLFKNTKEQLGSAPLTDSMTDTTTAPVSDNKILFIAENKQTQEIVSFGLLESFVAASKETWDITKGTLTALGQMFTGTRSATELGGIIRIGAIAGDMAQAGLIALISFTAILSINLGLINLFPIPMLDGGHLVFYALEGLKGSPVSEQIQEYAFRLGLIILVGIMLFANLNDIVQIIS